MFDAYDRWRTLEPAGWDCLSCGTGYDGNAYCETCGGCDGNPGCCTCKDQTEGDTPMPNEPRDLTDQHFGSWTVLHRHSPPGAPTLTWLCRCACGFEKPVPMQALTSGRTTQCRTCNGKRRERRRAAVAPGQVFANKLVLERDGERCLCRCTECGFESVHSPKMLLTYGAQPKQVRCEACAGRAPAFTRFGFQVNLSDVARSLGLTRAAVQQRLARCTTRAEAERALTAPRVPNTKRPGRKPEGEFD